MEFLKIKEILLDRINHYGSIEIDINAIKEATNEETLLGIIVSDISLWFNTNILTTELFVELFTVPTLEKHYIFVDGEHSVYGSKEVTALGNAIMRMYNNSTVYAFQNCTVYTNMVSSVFAHDNVSVTARNESTVTLHDFAQVSAYHNSKVYAYDYSVVYAFESVKVKSYHWVDVTLDDDASICAYDNSHVLGKTHNIVKLFNNASGDVYLRGCAEAHNNSRLSLFGETVGKLYGYSFGKCYDNSECSSFDSSSLYCDGQCKVKGYNISHIECKKAAFAQVSDMAYMIDCSDTHCNVYDSGIIKWYKSGQIFTNNRICVNKI